MPLSRSYRSDRRRRAIRESVAADSEFAVESVRAKRRIRSRDSDEADETQPRTGYRDPGYSKMVRHTCQTRLVQFIPVRRRALAAVVFAMWMVWLGLVVAHYLLFTSPINDAYSTLPIAQLLNLKQHHSVANWMSTQLWMLTAVASWMIFQLRRHKLDDYRARYRIWIALAAASVFCSFDASTTFLLQLGYSIDGWTRREIGYGGWPLVLAAFASLIGLIGLRLTSELKQIPASLVLWLGGLLAWACSALLGTGLLKTDMAPATLDLISAASWLGGILAVFQAAGIYLRQSYIHAQKRFITRQNLASVQQPWRMPKLSLKRRLTTNAVEVEQGSDRRDRNDGRAAIQKRSWLRWRSRRDDDHDDDLMREEDQRENDHESARDRKSRAAESSETRSNKRPARLFGVIPHRKEANERLEHEPIKEDDGGPIDVGLTKTGGWFGIGGNKQRGVQESKSSISSNRDSSESRSQQRSSDEAKPKGRWLPTFGKKNRDPENERERRSSETSRSEEQSGNEGKRGWMSMMKPTRAMGAVKAARERMATNRAAKAQKRQEAKVAKATATEAKRTKSASQSSDSAQASRGVRGWFDGFKLKPPTESSSNTSTNSSTSSSNTYGSNTNNSVKPVPVSQNRPLPSTQSNQSQYDRDDDEADTRPLSKAERKRLRRQQDDRRAA